MSASVLCACSGNSDSKTSDVSSQTESSDSENSDQSNTTATISEDSFENVNMINLYIPDGFDSDTGMSLMDARGYCAFFKEFGSDTIYFNFDNFVGYKVDGCDLEDIPEIAADSIKNALREIFNDYPTKSEYTVDSETTESINDMSFLNQKGNIHLEYRENGTHELSYTVYYTSDEDSYDTKVPVTLFIFSDNCTAETEEEMDRVAKEIINNSDWDFEY